MHNNSERPRQRGAQSSTAGRIALAAALLLTASAVQAQLTVPALALQTAKVMGDACERKAAKENWKMVIAVVDAGGNLKYFSRMEDSFLVSVRIAQLKAETSAGIPVSSRQWGELSKTTKGLDLVPGTASFAGGLPIMTAANRHIGGIGVSGGSADQDEECAKAGIDAARELLK